MYIILLYNQRKYDKMRLLAIGWILLSAFLSVTRISGGSLAKDGEIQVRLQFLEYELEDLCMTKNEVMLKFLNGTETNLKKILQVELKESDLYKSELDVLQKHIEAKAPDDRMTQRLVDIFSHPGAPLLGNAEFKEYRDYSIKLEELKGTMKIECSSNENSMSDLKNSETEKNCSSINHKKINKILFLEKDEEKLKDIWVKWYKELEAKNKKTKYDFVQQLSILDLEAEQNGEEDLTEYWLKQSDITWVNYETVKTLWEEIQPLYNKLKNYMKSLIDRNFEKNYFNEKELITAHILGSLETHDWVTAAEKLGAFNHSDAYKAIKASLSKNGFQHLYKMADNLTAEFKLGYLPHGFYEKSRFNESSQTCQNIVTNYCKRENVVRAISCSEEIPKLKHYIKIVEDTLKLKYLMLSGKEEEENGYLFREGPRNSVLYEAMESLSSLKALLPENLRKLKLLPDSVQPKEEILSLFITALNVIPPLPYYLSSDLWRINALKEIDAVVGENTADTTTMTLFSSISQSYQDKIYKKENSQLNGDSEDEFESNQNASAVDITKTYSIQNLTKDWWNFRSKYQGIGSPDGKIYEDYLQDSKIIWNKPYISKFLGNILQFQILENLNSINNTNGLLIYQSLMLKGKSKPWQILAEELLNITEISVKPLLKYFKPLEEYLDKGIKNQNQTPIFIFDDLKFVPQSFSLNPGNKGKEGEKPSEGSDALVFSLAIVAAIGIVAIIVTIGRRRYKKRQRARERKRRLAAL